MLPVLLVLVAADAAEPSGNALSIPYLSTPSSIEGKPIPVPSANPWRASSALTGTGEFLNKIRAMYKDADQPKGQEIDLEKQKQYVAEINTLSQQIEAEAAAAKAAQDDANKNEERIVKEGDALVQVHGQEAAQASLFNAAASVANQLLLSEHSWQGALGQAGKVESFVAGDDNDIVGVLDGGEAVLTAADKQLQELDDEVHERADELNAEMKSLFEWNFKATQQVNDQTHGLVDLMERTARLTSDFDAAHDKIVEMIQTLASEQKDVHGATAASLLQERAQAAVTQPRGKLLVDGGLDDIGFWQKLHVLKDLFETKFDETLEPISMIQKKFHDA